METELENFVQVEQIFGRSIQNTPSLPLFSSYIDYVRRRYPLEEGENRKIIIQAYEFVLPHVGIDINAGKLWTDYIEILKSGPGILGGSGWQDMQKMDILRKAYQRAIAVPTNATMEIWRDYDRFEMNLNKVQVRDLDPTFFLHTDANVGSQTPPGEISIVYDSEECRNCC